MPVNDIARPGRQNCVRGAALIALLLSYGVAPAAEAISDVRYQFEQPSQPVSDSLRAIAMQTGVSVLFSAAAVNGRMSHALSGQMSAAEAISRALDGTGLSAQITGDRAIVVKPTTAPGAAPARSIPTSAAASSVGEATFEVPPIQVAQSTSSSADPIAPPSKAEQPPLAAELGHVEVTGSRLKRIDSDGPTPVNVYTRTDIDKSGQPTLERFLSSLNEASVNVGEGGVGQTQGQGAIQLRGLPLGSTLVLINGRRVQAVGSSSGDFFNLNLIPMAAVERVEVVPVGSSAVYGGDALAGVVNVILKKSIDGVAFDARIASAKGTNDGGVSLATGRRDEDGSFLLLGSFNKTRPLTMGERDFFKDGDYRRFGGTDARTRACTPGTVSSTTGANLPGLGSSFAAIPSSSNGRPLTVSSFAATAGQASLCNPLASGNGTALVYDTEDVALHAAGERRLTGAWSIFGEATFVNDRLQAEQGGLQLRNVLVPAANPYNPFGADVRVTSRLGLENGSETLVRNTDFTRVLLGARADLGAGWDFEASVSSTRDDGQGYQNNNPDVAARDAALGASTPAAALNPFTTGVAASNDVMHAIFPGSPRDNHGRKDQASAFIRGAAFQLPAGKADLVAGIETSHDRYRTVSPGVFDIEGSRTASAVYGEMRLPLMRAAASTGAAWDLATLTVAGRRDKYSDFGSANTYQAGAEVRPSRTLLLRASTASSFKPPTLLQTHVDDQSFTTDLYGLVDPARNGAAITDGEVLRTTNHSLGPEKGRAYSFGAVWEPESASGTRLALTAWRVKINGLISLLWPQDAVDHPDLFPGFVTRAPSADGTPGEVTRVLYQEVNFGGIDTSGMDMEVAHSWKTAAGKWAVSASATRTNKYEVAIAPGAPAEDRLGRRAQDYWAPKWKGRLSAGLDAGVWNIGLTSRYLGAYKDVAPSERGLGGYWVHDLAGTVNLRRLGINLTGVKEASLSVAVVNVADRLPEYVETYPYYDFTQADWRGRYASLHLSMTW
jgi:iron complex outermembrane receptor protein